MGSHNGNMPKYQKFQQIWRRGLAFASAAVFLIPMPYTLRIFSLDLYARVQADNVTVTIANRQHTYVMKIGQLAPLTTVDAPIENPKNTKGGTFGKSKFFCLNLFNSHTTHPSTQAMSATEGRRPSKP